MFQMKLALGEITESSWNKKMYIDHDLEKVHPWYYSTYLIDDDIRVSFSPGKKSAMYKLDFSGADQRNLLFQGTNELKSLPGKDGVFMLEDKIIYKTRGLNSVTREMSVFIHAMITDAEGKPLEEVEFQKDKRRFAILIPEDAPSDILIKYAVSYISAEQAEFNFNKELSGIDFEGLVQRGKKVWEETVSQIQVEGGSIAQKRTFYTSLYRTYERMVDINEYGKYYSGYDARCTRATGLFMWMTGSGIPTWHSIH